MANLKQTSITGSSGTTTLLVSGSSILMPGMSGNVDSGSAAQMYIDITPKPRGLKMHLTQAGSFGSQNSPYTCLGAWSTQTVYPIGIQDPDGFGTSLDAIVSAGGYCGSSKSATYLWNGSTWSATGALNNARYAATGGGSQYAGIVAMGYKDAPNSKISCTEEFDGTSWATGGASPTARRKLAGAGQQNAFTAFGGGTVPAATAVTDEYNGSSWASGGNLNTSRAFLSGIGNATSALAMGGSPSAVSPVIPTTCVEEYNGTAWSTSTALMHASTNRATSGDSQDSAMIYGGVSPYKLLEEWNGNALAIGSDSISPIGLAGGSAGVSKNKGALSIGGSPAYTPVVQVYEKTLTLPFTFNSAVSSDS